MERDLLSTLRAEAQDDYVGLWKVVDDIRLLHPEQYPDEVTARSLDFVAEMLATGFVAVDLRLSGRWRRDWLSPRWETHGFQLSRE